MTAKVYNIEDDLPHVVSEVICINCKTRFICCRPMEILLKNLECCGCAELGCIIETGQDMDSIDGHAGEAIDYTRKRI